MIKFHKKFISIRLIFQTIFIFLNYIFAKCQCPKDNPIKKDGNCYLKFCTENDFKNGICSIENDIAKTQWLNNFIIFNEYRYRFSNMAINKKGDFIFETSSEELNGVRLFFGLKKNGKYYFTNNYNETMPIKKIIVLDDKNEGAMRYESNIFFIKIKNEKFEESKEFLLSISIFYGFMELYDLDDEYEPVSKVSAVDLNQFVNYAKYCPFIELNSKEYLYFFTGKHKDDDGWNNFYIIIKKYIFYDNILNLDNMQDIPTKAIRASYSRNTNAFKTDSNQIVLFYLDIQNRYKIEVLDENLETQKVKYFEQIPSSYNFNNEYFNKCIHLRDNIGIFIYYLKPTDGAFPYVSIEDIDIEGGSINTLFNFNLGEITKEYQFNGYPHLNNLIKINNKRFAYITTSTDKLLLYIILFDLSSSNDNIIIRYYKIYLYELYHYKIYNDISSIVYNNYLVISLSVCNSLQCDNKDSDSFYTSLLFFSYFNTSDFELNITSYFSSIGSDKNDDKEDITIPFPKNITIDNNIFGYQILEKIKIISIPNEINFYSIDENNKKTEIKVGEEINPNNINITISPKKNTIRNNNTYFIEYQYQYTDPDYDTFNKYPDKIASYPNNSGDQRDEFNQDIKIHFTESLKIEFKLCHENCKTCKIIGKSNRLTRCEECFENNKFLYDKKTNSKTCYPECPKEFPFIIFGENVKCSDTCDYDEIKNDICYLDNTDIETLKLVYSLLSNIILNEYNNEDVILKSVEDISFHLTNSLNEREKLYKEKNNYYNSSILDLGDCESKLKEINGIPENLSLIFLKFESYYENSSIKNVQYEIYNPITKLKISDLSICQNDKIDIYIPTNLDNETLIIYGELKNQGYDIYNPNDTFYNDICTKYTSVNYTDLTLNDRKEIFYDNKIFCQENCQYSGINLDIMHAKCECSLSTTEIEYESKKFSGIEIVTSFYEVFKYSNFLILKCYKIFFSLIGIKNNYGFIIMIVFLSLLIIFTTIFLFTGMKIIREQMAKMMYYTIHKINYVAPLDKNNNKLNINKYAESPPLPIKKKVKKKKKIIRIAKKRKTMDFHSNDNLDLAKYSKTTLIKVEQNISKVNNLSNSNNKVDLNSNLVLDKNKYGDDIYIQRAKTKKKSSILFSITKQKVEAEEIDIKENINKYREFELDDLE